VLEMLWRAGGNGGDKVYGLMVRKSMQLGLVYMHSGCGGAILTEGGFLLSNVVVYYEGGSNVMVGSNGSCQKFAPNLRSTHTQNDVYINYAKERPPA
jgi:hypothetical protein